MKKRVLLIAAVAIVGGWWFAKPVVVDYRAKARAEGYIRAQMRDPDSAKFTDVEIIRSVGTPYAICGSVNAKNAFGAYAGARRFYQPVDGPKDGFIMPDETERGGEDYANVERMFATLCSSDGLKVKRAAFDIMGWN